MAKKAKLDDRIFSQVEKKVEEDRQMMLDKWKKAHKDDKKAKKPRK